MSASPLQRAFSLSSSYGSEYGIPAIEPSGYVSGTTA
jgi:hypothetical protein